MKYLRNSGKEKKKKREDSDTLPAAKKIKKEYTQYPKPSELLAIPAGEDETSCNRNRKLLLSEERKLNPCKRTVSVLMDRTFAFRRWDIEKKPCPISDTLKLYPCLKRLDQVSDTRKKFSELPSCTCRYKQK